MVEALEAEGEAIVIHAEAFEDGGIEVADVNGVFNDVVGVVVGGAVADARFDSATRNPHAETATMVVAACAELPLAINGASKFTAPDNKGVF